MNISEAKKVITYDLLGKENGYLIELSKEGNLTTSYLSSTFAGAFKGYHLHKVRAANYICIKGEIKIIMYLPEGRTEVILSSNKPQKLHIPKNIPTGLLNESKEEALIVNNPEPAYDPGLKDEQVDYSEKQLERYYQQVVLDVEKEDILTKGSNNLYCYFRNSSVASYIPTESDSYLFYEYGIDNKVVGIDLIDYKQYIKTFKNHPERINIPARILQKIDSFFENYK